MDRQQRSEPVPSPSGLNDAIEKLMAHPELISMVASALGAGKGEPKAEESSAAEPMPEIAPEGTAASVPSAVPAGKEATSPPSVTPDVARLASVLAPLLSGAEGGKQDDPRACLLRALKPYVNPARRDAIDTMIRLSGISDLLRQLH